MEVLQCSSSLKWNGGGQEQGFPEVLTGSVMVDDLANLRVVLCRETAIEAVCATGSLEILVLSSLVSGPFALKTHELHREYRFLY